MDNTILDFDCVGIDDGGIIPISHTGRGQDLSPEFLIWNLSPNARTLAITLEDLTHPIRNFTHWVIWNIPAAQRIKSGIPAGKTVPSLGNARQGVAYGRHRYAGPKPPRRDTHFYRFTVYALDCRLDLKPRARKKAFLKAAEDHILQMGCIEGAFE